MESGATIESSGKKRDYYDLRRVHITLPYKEQFPTGPAYDQTGWYELRHWIGHLDWRNRAALMKGIEEGIASSHYGREKLRVEISSMMTGDWLQLGQAIHRVTPPTFDRGFSLCATTRGRSARRRGTGW